MQRNILEANPDLEIRVLAVWFDVLAGDDRSQWPDNLLTDDRVTHYWDPDGNIGYWFADRQDSFDTYGFVGSLAWDIYYLFGADAGWGDLPSPEIISGTTIVGTASRLESAIDEL